MVIKRLIRNLEIIVRPSYWIRTHRTNSLIDEKMNELLDKYEFTYVTEHTAFLGKTRIWISNHPYRSFFIFQESGMPSRKTVLRAYRKLKSVHSLDFKFTDNLRLKRRLEQIN